MKFACPCCDYLTFENKPDGSFEICPICYWEDDNVQNANPDFVGGANGISLNEAKKNFLQYGAIKAELIKHVRKPHQDEIKSN